MTETYKLECTEDYSIFTVSKANRALNIKSVGYRALFKSMRMYGFDPGTPIRVLKTDSNRYEVIDGQHRLHVAQELGLPVYYVVCNKAIPTYLLNLGNQPWKAPDYGWSFATLGHKDYEFINQEAKRLKTSVNNVAAVYAGTSSSSNINHALKAGRYKITKPEIGEKVCRLFDECCKTVPEMRRATVILSMVPLVQLKDFDADRFLKNLGRAVTGMIFSGPREHIFQCFEEIYNYGRRDRRPLSFEIKQFNAYMRDLTRDKNQYDILGDQP